MKRRAHFTLIELLASLALTALVVTLLLSFYRQIHQVGDNKILATVWHRYSIHQRLGKILPETSSRLLHSNGTDILCIFNNGIDLERPFSAEILARLYLDEHGRLLLSTWPSPDHWKFDHPPHRTEILSTDIQALSFEFYTPPDFSQNGSALSSGWSSEWNEGGLPAMIRTTITFADESFTSTHVINEAEAIPLYFKTPQQEE